MTHVNPLGKDDLVRILTEPEDSLTAQYKELLREDGISLEFTPEALTAIADEALSTGTGARGLRRAMEKVMRDVMYEAPMLAARQRSLTIGERRVRDLLEGVREVG